MGPKESNQTTKNDGSTCPIAIKIDRSYFEIVGQ